MTGLRKIIHIDMDAFYASVEQMDNPKLKGKPVIVGGDPRKRGVVAACSYEARQFGIHSAMPCAKAAKRCAHAVFTPPRMWRYQEISRLVMQIFLSITDLVEPLSLDEAFLDVTNNSLNNPSATRLAEIIRQRIRHETGLTASAGVSYNKFLAKIASDLNKPDGLSVILPEDAVSFLDNLPVGKFFGVGKVTEKKMASLGIKVGSDLRCFSREDLLHHFGKTGAFYYNIVRGIDERPVQAERTRKSIGSETTLQEDTFDIDEIDKILTRLADKVEEALLRKKCGGSTVTLKVRYHDFVTITRSATLPVPLFNADLILQQINRLKRSTQIGRKKVRLLGISLSKLTDSKEKKPVQLPLPFD
ncbi:MAG: DNA polymerase IV [Desulfocapsaceae bacterium]|nr:DNA polymerase IV [Desulfocapsaceae bacterium]